MNLTRTGLLVCLLAVAATSALTASPILLTADADAYIQSGASAGTNFGTGTALQVKFDSTSNDFNRKTYVRFDLSDYVGQTMTDATLTLTGAAPLGAGTSTKVWTFSVYGLKSDDAGVNWGETAINWTNAPGNNSGSLGGVDASRLFGGTALGTFTITGTGSGVVTPFSSVQMLNYLNAGLAAGHSLYSFILVRNTDSAGEGSNTVVHTFVSSESTTGNGSKLTLIPEPATLALTATGCALLMSRRRHSR